VQSVRIIVVEPKNPGNLGAIARLMRNFQLDDLAVVNIRRIPSEDIFRAMKGNEILSKAKMVNSLLEASRGLDYLIGTSGVKSESPKEVLRNYFEPEEFLEISKRIKGKVGIVLGR
jgi:tRNA/rRNA methyltransferase